MFFIEGTIESLNKKEIKIAAKYSDPMADIKKGEMYTPDITARFNVGHFSPIMVSGYVPGTSLGISYEKSGKCNCGKKKIDPKKIKPIKTKSKNQAVKQLADFRNQILQEGVCDCITPGTVTIDFKSADGTVTLLLLIDFTDTKVRFHWRKIFNSFNMKNTLGSTNESVIEFDRHSNQAFRFVIYNPGGDSMINNALPLFLMVGQLSNYKEAGNLRNTVTARSMQKIAAEMTTHNATVVDEIADWKFNIGKFAVLSEYSTSSTSYHTISPNGELVDNDEETNEGDDTDETAGATGD